MGKIYTRLPTRSSPDQIHFLVLMQDLFLSPFVWLYAWIRKFEGINFHKTTSIVAYKLITSKLLGSEIPARFIYSLLFRPIDTVRYFEFGSSWQALSGERMDGKYLDVSSPRLFPLKVLQENPQLMGTILNPDKTDLEITKEIATNIGLKNRVRFLQQMIEDMRAEDEMFDLITSLSVLEHIEEDEQALKKIWGLLKKRGSLILSLPCSKESFEEYVDFDEYRLNTTLEGEFHFGQRFYDETLLHDRIFSIVGLPVHEWIFDEKVEGWWFTNREKRLRLGRRYPQWKEPCRMMRSWRKYSIVDELPGVGVIIMKFTKK